MAVFMWTAETVKEQLPDAEIKLPGGQVILCKVRGRKRQFAQVVAGDGLVYEFAWKTIADSLNRGTCLRVG